MTKLFKVIQFATEVIILTLSGIELADTIKRLKKEKQQNNKPLST